MIRALDFVAQRLSEIVINNLSVGGYRYAAGQTCEEQTALAMSSLEEL
jgi:hypothetical protein